MDDGAEVDVKETRQRHGRHTLTLVRISYACVNVEKNHKQGGREPNGNGELEQKIHHLEIPFRFLHI